MIDLTGLIPEVQAAATSCPGFTAERAVLAAAIEFADMSWCLQEEHDVFDLEEGIAEYELDAPLKHRITGIINVRINGEPIFPYTSAEKDRQDTDWRTATGEYPTWYLRELSPTVKLVKLYPVPLADVDDAVALLMAVSPARNSTRIDDRFGAEHYDAIISGAISRVLMLPNKEWTNLVTASAYRNTFLDYAYSARNVTMNDVLRQTLDSRII